MIKSITLDDLCTLMAAGFIAGYLMPFIGIPTIPGLCAIWIASFVWGVSR